MLLLLLIDIVLATPSAEPLSESRPTSMPPTNSGKAVGGSVVTKVKVAKHISAPPEMIDELSKEEKTKRAGRYIKYHID